MVEVLMENLLVTKRNGEVVPFDLTRIQNAVSKAMRAAGQQVNDQDLLKLVNSVCNEVTGRFQDFYPNVENIQDIVEKHLMQLGWYETAKSYILYRAERQKKREEEKKVTMEKTLLGKLTVRKKDGTTVLFDIRKVRENTRRLSRGFEKDINQELVVKEVIKNIFDGITSDDIYKAQILACISFVERDPAYSQLASRIFLQKLYKEVVGKQLNEDVLGMSYRETFVTGIKRGVEEGILDRGMLNFDLDKLSRALVLERDDLFKYMGIQTIYERYLLKIGERRFELPQAFWMRVAMGLALGEKDREARAVEFYNAMSTMRYVPSTPTLFHSGTHKPQLSSCYLTTVEDDLNHIFKCLSDNAQLSKWSGGIGNDWSNLRATGAFIKSTRVESQGVIPFLKIANDVTAAINRSGKRRGATCAYLETWHLDFEDFLDLRRNTGDDRRRTHDMDTANWIPDLFMKRVMNDENWTLFSPEETPDLHHIFGKTFEKKYMEYEDKARSGQIKKHQVVSARKLWRKMLGRLFETGHPWITFKDPCNIRSPQDHCGVVHSSNLCTEITLNTSADETAVCNLGSINLARHVVNGKVDEDMLAKTTASAVRMLDNVVDINFYPTIEAQNSNMRHRPVGLGIMGLADTFFLMNVAYSSNHAIKVSDRIMEVVSYNAILASSKLAAERGPYASYKGSKWDRGILPHDTLAVLEEERGVKIPVTVEETMDWMTVRRQVREFGMRNSNVMAIAPTATIANISGVFPSIEPVFKNIYVKANISGEFTVGNNYLVDDLKARGLWNDEMLERLKYYDGSVQHMAGIPDELKEKYREAFEIDPLHCISMTAHRGKWIDQSQSHNVFMKGTSGKLLSEIYLHAWAMGLKTTYYLRSLAASQIEKTTLDAGKYGFTQKREYGGVEGDQATNGHSAGVANGANSADSGPKVCNIFDPGCESCQ